MTVTAQFSLPINDVRLTDRQLELSSHKSRSFVSRCKRTLRPSSRKETEREGFSMFGEKCLKQAASLFVEAERVVFCSNY